MLKWVIAMLALGVTSALAHSWYPAACCSDNDCHPVSCEALKETGTGFEYNGAQFTREQVKNSQDSSCHVCIHEFNPFGAGAYRKPMCVFILTNS